MVRHIVLYRLRAAADADALGDALSALAAIEDVRELQCGPNSSIVQASGGFDYGLHVRFDDESARARYLADPRHLAVVPTVESLTSSLLVFGITSAGG
jgi:hypothetical protein